MTEQPQLDRAVGRPRIHAVIQTDGTGAITIDGSTRLVAEADTTAARRAISSIATDVARQLGHEVRMTSTDPDGQWWLVITPDGRVHTEAPQRPRSRAMEPEPALESADGEPAEGHLFATTGATATAEATEDTVVVEPVARHAAPDDTYHDDQVVPATEPVPARATESWPPRHAFDGAVAAAPAGGPLPTLTDLLDSRPTPPPGPAEWGWQGTVRRATFGLVKPDPSPAELQHRRDVAAVQRSLAGPRTIVVVNPKGGAHKTTATMLIAATFGLHRGGYTLAWDNNETRGTLGWRAMPSRHSNTAVNLLADLERFDDPARARIGDLDNYVRGQGSAQFDVLASDEDAGASASIEANAFRRLHAALSRFYRIMVIDTGNNMRASNWGAAVEAADQLVIVSTVREDTAASAAWLLDGLRSRRYEDKVSRAVTLLSSPGLQPDPGLLGRLHQHFGQLTRAVIDVPYDPALVDGAAIDITRLQGGTREAWLHATAVIAEGL